MDCTTYFHFMESFMIGWLSMKHFLKKIFFVQLKSLIIIKSEINIKRKQWAVNRHWTKMKWFDLVIVTPCLKWRWRRYCHNHTHTHCYKVMRMDNILALSMRVQSKVLQLIVLIGKLVIFKFLWRLFPISAIFRGFFMKADPIIIFFLSIEEGEISISNKNRVMLNRLKRRWYQQNLQLFGAQLSELASGSMGNSPC